MSFNRRPGGRSDRPRRFDRGDRPDRFDRGDRSDRFDRGDRPDRDQRPRDAWRPSGPRPPAPRRGPDRFEDAGMSIRLDPRRLGTLKQLAGEAGLRPGELVLQWVEARIDAERRGEAPPAVGAVPADLDALAARLDELAARVAALETTGTATTAAAADEPAELAGAQDATTVAEGSATEVGATVEPESAPRRRGRPRKTPAPAPPAPTGPRVALHDEIIAVIEERGASTAAEIAQAIAERGRYAPPRSGKGLDAATVNSRVSNPAYRDRFARQGGRIGLAGGD